MIIRRQPILSLILCLVALGASACSADRPALAADAKSSVKLTPQHLSATPTPSPDPTTSAAVEAGVRAWLAAANQAFATGETSELRHHMEPSCDCLHLLKTVKDYWAAGGIRGLRWTLHRMLSVDINYHIATAQFVFDETSYRVVRSGHLSSIHAADRITVFTQFALKGGVWRLWNYTRVDVTPL
jgi:hypothetical protein